MFNTKQLRAFAISMLAVMAICISLPFATALADEPDYTDNDTAVEYIESNATLSGDDAATAADTFISNYTDNVGSIESEKFTEDLNKALDVKREGNKFYSTIWSLLPPIIAILLALITKEVYSSLFIGILSGALLYSGFSLSGTIDHLFVDGFISSVADSYNIGIIIFLVILGTIVAMMNKSGGSAAFGRWATKHIKTRVGAQLATIALGVLIFVDDYFNCLTVGSVMRPVSDKFKVSRSKLAYLIDATAAPICIIAPVSSWAAAVAGFVSESEVSGFGLFLKAIPYNYYALLTILAMIMIACFKIDFGPMKKHEKNAEENGDIFSEKGRKLVEEVASNSNERGIVWDLIAPVAVLILACIIGLLYSGGYYTADSDTYHMFIDAFSSADASVGLVIGSFVGLIFSVIYYMCRKVISFKDCMDAIPEGFKAMVPAILILCCAWTLKAMTDSLGAKLLIAEFVRVKATGILPLIPAIVFLIGVGLSFATGTSWGTFGILIPIVLAVFGETIQNPICIIAISACMAGAVCGDHCSPISDTTIMASAGAQCNHINHVNTQLPYALTVAGVSFVSYIIAGFVKTVWICLPISVVLMVATLLIIKSATKAKN